MRENVIKTYMLKGKAIFLFWLFITVSHVVLAQDYLQYDALVPKIIPPSPEAAALGQYADFPVSYHTGTPSISIPLYEISMDGFSLPISLSYHASGIKVNQEASWVGLGWVLNAGGMVNRTVMGRDDFEFWIDHFSDETNYWHFPIEEGVVPDFYRFTSGALYPDEGTKAYVTWGAFCPEGDPSCRYGGYLFDTEPDIFSFNFNGRTGKFMFTREGEPLLFPHQDLQISISEFNENATFTIIDEKGVIYTFSQKEKVRTIRSSNDGPLLDRRAYTGYYLTKIELANGKEVNFNYSAQSYITKSPKNYTTLTAQQANWSQDEYWTWGWNLTSITWGNSTTDLDGTIEFIPHSSYREDYKLHNPDTPKRLFQIIVKNSLGAPIKKFQLGQSYFTGAQATVEYKRLRLDNLIEFTPSASQPGADAKTYEFTYDNRPMSSKLTFGDHWGYFGGTNRAPEFPEMRAGILSEIKYPTGGTTQFTYEPHQYERSLHTEPKECEIVNTPHTASLFPDQGQYVATKTFYHDGGDIQWSFDIYGLNCEGPNGEQVDCNSTYSALHRDGTNDLTIRLIKVSTGAEVASIKWTDSFDGALYYSPGAIVLSHENGYLSPSISGIDEASLRFSSQPAGEYTIEITLDPDFISNSSLDEMVAQVSDYETVCSAPVGGGIVGGLRIKTKAEYDHTGALIRRRDFEYSGGVLFNRPSYKTDKPQNLINLGYLGFAIDNLITEEHSGQMISLSIGQGVHVGYDEVKLIESDKDGFKHNGYTIFEYDNNPEDFDEYGFTRYLTSGYVFAPDHPYNPDFNMSLGIIGDGNMIYDGSRYDAFPALSATRIDINVGNLIRTTYYNHNDIKVKQITNSYEVVNKGSLMGINIAEQAWNILPGEDPFVGYRHAIYAWYEYQSVYNRLLQTAEVNYDDNEQPLVSTLKVYDYGTKHLMPISIETNTSNGESAIEKTYYSPDVTNDSFLHGGVYENFSLLSDLNTANRLEVIQKESWVDDGQNTQLLGVQRNVFDEDNNMILPWKLQTAIGDTDVLTQIVFEHYNSYGKPMEVRTKTGLSTCYFWGYKGLYPIAKIENATLDEIGVYLGYDVATLKTFDESDLSVINSLRAWRSNTLVTTYTYKPQVGLLTVTDPNDIVTDYTYDNFNRLKLIRDNDSNIITEYDYHYKGQ
jgi:YD repeat-containing protein